jgi:hypothetical protein
MVQEEKYQEKPVKREEEIIISSCKDDLEKTPFQVTATFNFPEYPMRYHGATFMGVQMATLEEARSTDRHIQNPEDACFLGCCAV